VPGNYAVSNDELTANCTSYVARDQRTQAVRIKCLLICLQIYYRRSQTSEKGVGKGAAFLGRAIKRYTLEQRGSTNSKHCYNIQSAPKSNPTRKILYLWNCNRLFHQI